MSDRNQDILRQLIKNKKIKEETLLTEFGITARQLSYTIQNINDKLMEKGLSIIEKQQGYFICPRETIDYLTIHQTLQDIVFSKEDRMYLILIMILTRKEELSLDHFSIELKMSKNTIVNDIKQTKVMLEPFHLEIEFSRKEGYRIHGKEWDKRIVLSNAITKIYKIYGENVTNELLVNTHKYIEIARKAILRIEKYLGIKYTDEDFYPLTYFLAAILIRIERKQLVTIEDFKDPDEIKHTKEYQALSYVFTEFPYLSQSETLYIALQLLSANVRSNHVFTELDLPLLSNSLWEFLIEFEANTFLVLKDKKELLGKLINHFKPAYYRIKYNLPVDNVLYEKISSEYRVLHGFVRQSFWPIENFFQTEISDEEIAYITLFVGGHLLANEQNDFEDKVTRAVILCPNGISMSKLIENKLKEIFPEFLFYPTNSIREYKKFVLPHDVVFSTVPVVSEKKVYVINEILTNYERVQLRKNVIKDLFQIDFEGIQSTDILSIVKKYASVTNEKKLLEELDSLVLRDFSEIKEEYSQQSNLVQLLNEETISIIEEEINWEEALEITSNQLVKQEIISTNFFEALRKEYSSQPEYILLRQKLILPHLDPDLISQKLGVSVLIAKKGIWYNEHKIHVVILLTTPNKTNHLNILFDINRMVKDNSFIEQLSNADNWEQVIQMIQYFIKEGNTANVRTIY
uniref:BglG family transcription antiterminator n=1 Tax=Candidatus Enterococcus willemsii TaxID=1857215 RepID=UPI00403F9D29